MRWRNGVRLPLLSGPLSLLIWIRLVSAFACSSIVFHLASIVSTMKSLVLYELPKVMANSPIFTVAFQSILQRWTPANDTACSSFFYIVEDGISLFALLLGCGLHDLAQPKAQAIEHVVHGTG